MTETDLYPVELRRHRKEKRLEVVWSDDHRHLFDYDFLRGYCPCAACQGHLVRQIKFQPPKRPVDLLSIEPVGNYAVTFLWSDGHSTGIYRFDFLLELEEKGRGEVE